MLKISKNIPPVLSRLTSYVKFATMGIGIYVGDSHACAIVSTSLHGTHSLNMVTNNFANTFTPCLVAYTDKGVLVGDAARAHGDRKNTVYGMRRMLGKTYQEVTTLPMFQNCPFTIIKNEKDDKFRIEVELCGAKELVTPEEVLKHLLAQIYQDTKNATGEDHKDAVLSVRAEAKDAERQALKDSATLAGLHPMRIMNETSAAIGSLSRPSATLNRVLVVKIGSYATDLALVEEEEGIVETLSLDSVNFAGDKLDEILEEYFWQHKLKGVQRTETLHRRLLRLCEHVKCKLSTSVEHVEEFEIGEKSYKLEISSARFENLIKEYVDSLVAQVQKFVAENAKDVHTLLLVGGGANIPVIKSKIEAALKRKATSPKCDASEAICRGVGNMVSLLCNCATRTITYHVPVPNRNVKGSGLYGNSKDCPPIPMTGASVNVEVLDVMAKVFVKQSFLYQGENAMEVVYLWPVDSRAAVCNFKAKVGDKEYEGEIREKEVAFQIYDEAISESHGAFLMEKVSGDIFQINLGNLLPNTEVTISMEYVTTLTSSDRPKVTFTLPTIVSNPYTPHAPDYDTSLPNTTRVPTTLSVTCHTSTPIHSITSPTHTIIQKSTENVELGEGQELSSNFMLHIILEAPLEHVAWISNAPGFGPPAVLFSVPTHPLPEKMEKTSNEFIFLIDRSGSMSSRILQAKTALLLFIKSLPQNSFFNIIGFGSMHESLFQKSQPYTEENVAVALQHLESLEANLGGTEIMEPIRAILEAPLIADTKQIILVTDGEVSNTDEIVSLVKDNKKNAQIHTLGIGDDCSRYLILEVAKAGDGAHDFVLAREPLGPKVIGLLKSASRPFIKDVFLEYTTSDNRKGSASIKSTFKIDDQLLCFAELDPNVYPPAQFKISTALCRHPDLINSTVVKLQPTNFSSDNLIQIMTAYAQIQELELTGKFKSHTAGNPDWEKLLKLSLDYKLMSRAASYIIVEKRTGTAQESTMLPEATVRKSGDPLYTLQQIQVGSQDILLLDVTPLDMDFTDGAHGFVTVIPRNSTIPCKKWAKYSYQVPSGGVPELLVYEHKSNLLGPVPVPVATPYPPSVELEICYDIDANGMLSVSIQNLDSGVIEKKTFSNDKGRLTKDQIDALVSGADSSAIIYPRASDQYTPRGPMLDLVKLQKLDGLWALDEKFAKLFENPTNISTHPNLATILTFVKDQGTAETLWATALALAFFYSDEMLARKSEWELLVEKSLESIRKILSDETKVEELLKLGKQGFAENKFFVPPPPVVPPSESRIFYGDGLLVEEVD
eukprot:Phypoly_transcript_00837.p1 GENE.Phypoly_transcript_00837~~Phypoly_transcript_00837.p1  ORF type:complete len:1288 (+),score=250.88 Phypoly_transcript_00837:78-3941(+)